MVLLWYQSFGNGISFAWAPVSNTYAVLENETKLRMYEQPFRGGVPDGRPLQRHGRAAEILPTLNKVARFLGKDYKELAMQVTTDPDRKSDLSLHLNDLDTALGIARSAPDLEMKRKAPGDCALAVWRFDPAKECFESRTRGIWLR